MVTGTIPLHKLIQYSYAITATNGDWFIFHQPDGATEYKIKLDAASITLLKTKQQALLNLLNQQVTLSGVIVETKKLQDVTTPPVTKPVWVLQ